MIDFYLITGFLGAGKTSLLKSILPLFDGKSIRLIINEFGKVGLDGALMRELCSNITEITNGSIFCACRLDQFEQALNKSIADKPDVILVEASGLSDPGTIRNVLSGYEHAGLLNYCGTICLVDAPRFQKLIETARACKKQLAVADLVLINKCDLVNPETVNSVEQLLHGICLAPVIRTSFGKISRSQLETMQPIDHAIEPDHRPDLTLQRETLKIAAACTHRQILHILSLLAEDTYRIKGFLAISDGNFLVDCVGDDIRVTPHEGTMNHANALTLLSGEGMPLRKSIQRMLSEFHALVTYL